MKDVTLDSVIEGRVEPHIYAFSTGTIPNYLKIGDTHRTVARRLNEWKEHYPDLVEEFSDVAKVSDDKHTISFSDVTGHSPNCRSLRMPLVPVNFSPMKKPRC